MNLASLSIKRPTFIFSILVMVIIIGLMFMDRMQVRMMPDVEFPYVRVSITYPGAGPEEIENRVSNRVENAMSSISGLKHISSVSQDGISNTFAEFDLAKDPEIALQEVKDKIAEIRRAFPDDIDEPVVQKIDPEARPIMTISLKADLAPKELYDFADEYYRKELLRVDGISSIWMAGGTRREVQVAVDRNKLNQYDTTLSAVSNSIKNNSMNIPIGRISIGDNDVSFRSMGEYRTVDDIKQVVVNFHGNEVPVSVGDVATVQDTIMERYTLGRIDLKENGKVIREQTLLFRIFKQSKANEVNISNAVLKKVNELNARYKGAKGDPLLTVVTDNAKVIRDNIDDVKETIYIGILLAVIVVYFFLGSWRSTLITALALPNSLIGAFIFMYLFDFSINVISLMSLSLAVGLLIDDAIVVRENIYRHYEEGEEPDVAAQKGTDEVSLAVIATTSSVIAVFLPVGFLSGIIGQFFKEFGLTVVFAMLISVLDALTIAPMLSAYIIPSHKKEAPKLKGKTLTSLTKISESISKVIRLLTVVWFEKFLQKILNFYEKIIKIIINNKIKVLLTTVLIFALSLPLFFFIPRSFMPESESGEFRISVETAPDASLAKTNAVCIQIEDAIMAMPEVEFAVVSIGNNSKELNIADIYVRLVKDNKRKLTTEAVKTNIRAQLAQTLDKSVIISLNDSGTSFGGNQKPFSLLIFGRDTKQLSAIADSLIAQFKNIPGLVDLSTNFRSGKPEYQIDINPKKAKDFGVNSVVAGAELRAMVEGNLPAVYRTNGLEYDIRVNLKADQRDITDSFNSLYVFNMNNKRIKLSRVATLKQEAGPTKIYRRDRIRYIEISGNLSKGATLGVIQKATEKILLESKTNPQNAALWNNITYQYGGNVEEMQNLGKNIQTAVMLSVIFIFIVLASLYESVITPLTIMISLPLAVVGGLIALFVTHGALDMFTMIGLIMLLGIVAKNSIILVDYIQQLMRRGKSVNEAVIEAGKVRLRPILMTSFALAAGMLPTALALSEVGKFRQSMGIVIIGGIISSTILTLLIIPAIFEYMNSFRLWTRKKLGRTEARKIDKELDQEAKNDN
ncbi:efflux RND transporter permease subunit [Endomicrobium proavitum]|uniref:Multidrug efflux system, subunit C n=1 Tax=Endomicrobium proavitum TaxID=1408281 RepID=A0A0G3WKE0_9BACT|nr:efflux RND transporter permease subunit [Endomicrobium proavitum]AKL98370.1 multidrug efflux system, subunit C [Endomicrobium proavitum]